MKTALAAAFVLLWVAASASAQSVVFLVRHAERADAGMTGGGMMAKDPDLSEAGRARAEALASMLRDAGIKAIFTTEFRRTRQTVEPLARLVGITPTVVAANDTAALVKHVRAVAGQVLVVGHSNTLPEIIEALGVPTTITIGDAEYDNLFVITPGPKPALVRLRFR